MKFKDKSNNFKHSDKFIEKDKGFVSEEELKESKEKQIKMTKAKYKPKRKPSRKEKKKLREYFDRKDKKQRETGLTRKEDRQSDNTQKKEEPQQNKKADKKSKFVDSKSQTESSENTVDTRRTEDTKKRAAKKSVSTVIDLKGKVREDFQGEKITGNAMDDGNKGAVGLFTTLINPLTYLKILFRALIAYITPILIAVVSIALLVTFIVVFIIAIATNSSKAGANGLEGFLEGYQANGRMKQGLSVDEINEIKGNLFMTESQNKAVSFALDKVGMAYSQPLRTSGRAYDCSSLAYYVYLYAGIDTSRGGGYPPTADQIAKYFVDEGKAIPTNAENFSLAPGDLIFYARDGENYYMNIYHVAIYIGNGYAVEALNTKYGVVYQPLRTKNAVLAAHGLD